MRLLSIVAVAVALTGCDGCNEEAPPPPAGDAAAASIAGVKGRAPFNQAAPGAVYKNAYERAKKETTADNAAGRLREMERSIDREAGSRR
jgi:hypothetical protein